jgi:pre-mRNA-processing factor 6
VAMEIEEEGRLDTWDAESVKAKGMVGTARSTLACALKVYPDRKSPRRKAADLEKAHGTRYVSSLRFSCATTDETVF